MHSPAADPRSIVVFRKRLLAYSETFIATQGHALRRFQPVFAGFHQDKGGLHHVTPDECELIARSRAAAELLRWPMRLGAAPPRGWLKRLRAHRPALVHAHFGADGHAAIPLARALGVPLVTTCWGHDILGILDPAQKRRLAGVFRHSRAVIAASKFVEQALHANGCPPEKIVQHYIGIDLSLFSADRREATVPTLLFVGRLVPSKGAALAIEATAALQQEFPGLRLVIVGNGPERERLEAQAAGCLRNYEFTGAIPPARVRDLMQQAWLFCAPRVPQRNGYAEALGLVFLESQACGLPVVATRNGGIGETVAHGDTGLLSPEGDLPALIGDLRTLLADAARRTEFSRAARRHVAEHFDLVRQTETLEDLYRSCIASPSAG